MFLTIFSLLRLNRFGWRFARRPAFSMRCAMRPRLQYGHLRSASICAIWPSMQCGHICNIAAHATCNMATCATYFFVKHGAAVHYGHPYATATYAIRPPVQCCHPRTPAPPSRPTQVHAALAAPTLRFPRRQRFVGRRRHALQRLQAVDPARRAAGAPAVHLHVATIHIGSGSAPHRPSLTARLALRV